MEYAFTFWAQIAPPSLALYIYLWLKTYIKIQNQTSHILQAWWESKSGRPHVPNARVQPLYCIVVVLNYSKTNSGIDQNERFSNAHGRFCLLAMQPTPQDANKTDLSTCNGADHHWRKMLPHLRGGTFHQVIKQPHPKSVGLLKFGNRASQGLATKTMVLCLGPY